MPDLLTGCAFNSSTLKTGPRRPLKKLGGLVKRSLLETPVNYLWILLIEQSLCRFYDLSNILINPYLAMI